MDSSLSSEPYPLSPSDQVQVECDKAILELPEDIEGLLLLNINSYMGGVDLWASGASYGGQALSDKQSFCDGRLEVCCMLLLPITPPFKILLLAPRHADETPAYALYNSKGQRTTHKSS